MLEKYGYPFKSKLHSHNLHIFQNSGLTDYIERYINGVTKDGGKSRFSCPDCLKYQFKEGLPFRVSEQCCNKLKKEIAGKIEKEKNKSISITGVRQAEGGIRSYKMGCIAFKKGKLKQFKPLNPASDAWLDWYIKTRHIQLCRLYYPPFNFTRTGCKGCPFAMNLAEELEVMERLLPAERKQCETIWKKVYDEYRRIGYRLKK